MNNSNDYENDFKEEKHNMFFRSEGTMCCSILQKSDDLFILSSSLRAVYLFFAQYNSESAWVLEICIVDFKLINKTLLRLTIEHI
jgi:sulfur relay (sulfurtransferase) DsrF/TusC family protein